MKLQAFDKVIRKRPVPTSFEARKSAILLVHKGTLVLIIKSFMLDDKVSLHYGVHYKWQRLQKYICTSNRFLVFKH